MTNAMQSLILPADYKPAALKELRSQSVSTESSYADGVPLPEDFGDLASAYNTHVWVYAACWAIASNYAMLKFKAYEPEADGQWAEILNYPFVDLLDNPNPYMSGYNIREFLALSLELTGNAYLAREKDSKGNTTELWPIPSANLQPVASKSKMIDHYLYKVGGVTIKYDYNEIIHIQYMNPTDFLFGQGSLQAVKQSVMTDIYAAMWNKTFFKNAARPDAVFETDQVIGEEVRKRVMSGWKAMHQGADKRGKTAVLEGGIKLRDLNWTHTDMEFTELRKMSREEILAAFGVPPIMCGILEYANYANAKEQTAIFWKHTMLPKVRAIQDKITMRVRQIDLNPYISIESDTSSVEALRVDENQRAQTAKLYYQMGVPLNAIIDKFDLPFDPVEGGDVSHPATAGEFGAFGAASMAGKTPNVVINAGITNERTPQVKKNLAPTKASFAAEWKAYDAKFTAIEERFIAELKVYFRGQQRRVQAAFEAHAPALLQRFGVPKAHSGGDKPKIDVGVFFDQAKEQKRLREVVHQYVVGTYVDFATTSGKKIDPLFKFNLQDPKALAWISEKELELVRNVTDYTMETLTEKSVNAIHDALEEGLAQGETIQEIADRIDETYELARESRAERIARTEILSASNQGSLEGMKQAGVEGKMWLAAQETKFSRDWHKDMDGVVVPVDEEFILSTGTHMNAPGDPKAGPDEIVNCRCTIRSVRNIDEEET